MLKLQREAEVKSKKSNSTSLIRAKRSYVKRSPAEISAMRDAMLQLLEAEQPMTIRHLFYRLVSLYSSDKTERFYNNVLCPEMKNMRKDCTIPYEWLVDSSRWMRRPQSFNSIRDALQNTYNTYRRELWRDQHFYCEVWCEKDTITSMLAEVTEEYDVPLMVTSGFSSLSFLYSTAQRIKAAYEVGKASRIFVFTDYDPSGSVMVDVIRRDLTEMSGVSGAKPNGTPGSRSAPVPWLEVQKVAVSEYDVLYYKLPTRPTKKIGNSHAAKFDSDESVELDALSAADLQGICRYAIEGLIDPEALAKTRVAEKSEKESMRIFFNTGLTEGGLP